MVFLISSHNLCLRLPQHTLSLNKSVCVSGVSALLHVRS